MTCAHCGATLEGRKRKYCDKLCCNRAAEAKRMRSGTPCSVSECGKPTRARGLCMTHYNQQHQPNRHKPKTVDCVVCGKRIERSMGGGGRKYGATCSTDCRRILTHGDRCAIPADHWARWYGKSSAVRIGSCTKCGEPYAAQHPLTEQCRRCRSHGREGFQCGHCDECGWLIVEPAGQAPSRWCSTTCRGRVKKRARKAREYGSPGTFRYSEVMRQYRRQGSVCAYCRKPSDGLPEPEHVIALSRGGRNDMSNIVAACRRCNSDKRDLPISAWNADRKRRGLAPVNTSLDGPAYLHLAA